MSVEYDQSITLVKNNIPNNIKRDTIQQQTPAVSLVLKNNKI